MIKINNYVLVSILKAHALNGCKGSNKIANNGYKMRKIFKNRPSISFDCLFSSSKHHSDLAF